MYVWVPVFLENVIIAYKNRRDSYNMGLLDKFLDAIKLNDDFDDEDEFFDEDEDFEDDFEEEKPKRRFFKKLEDDFDDLEDDFDEPKVKAKAPVKEAKPSYKQTAAAAPVKPAKQKANNKITPMRKKAGTPSMEVIVIRPTTMEDTRDIADTLLNGCTVVLNLEGLDVYLAQRIIDFTCGACYSLNGSLQKISSYIYILTPAGVDISGDFQEILSGAFDIPAI